MSKEKTIRGSSLTEMHAAPSARVFELSLAEESQKTSERPTLDPDSIRSLRSMFLLLDEWDRALEHRKTESSSEECEILIDIKAN